MSENKLPQEPIPPTSGKKPLSIVGHYLNEFHKKQREIKGRLIFRGLANEKWNVVSSAGRRLIKDGRIKQNDYIRYHVNLIANARKNGYNKLEADSKLSELEVLAEIQHYGGATCLTDFSTNFLVALWFASQKQTQRTITPKKGQPNIYEESEIPTNGKVIWLDLGEEKNFNNIYYYNTYKKGDSIQHLLTKRAQNFNLKMTVEPRFWFWDPTKLNNRIIKQDSVFVFGLAQFPLYPLSDDKKQEEIKIQKLSFDQIIIYEDDKLRVREELDSIFGINAETVFFDLTGYSNDANAPEMPISEKLLSNKPCLQNAKENIKKEQYSIADNYLEEAITCKREGDKCKKGLEKCSNDSLGELYFWKGEAYDGKEETNEALLAYFQASTQLIEEYKINPNEKILRLLYESFRNQSIIYYAKKDYEGAFLADSEIEIRYWNQLFPNENEDGADAVFALLELSIFKLKPDQFDLYLKRAKNINPVLNNGEILLYYFEELGNAIFNQKIDIHKIIDEIEDKVQKIIDHYVTNQIKGNLIGYYHWEYNDTLDWIEHVKERDALTEEEKEIKTFLEKHTAEFTLLAKKADEAQAKLYNWTLTENNSVNPQT